MKRLPSRLDLFNSVFFTYATVALLAAAALVIYLQHQALTAQDAQTSVILRKISEQAALAVESEIRRVFDGPVLETVTAVSHADVMEGRVDLIADQFARGTRDYPHVERFFVWTADTQSIAPDEVLFYGPAPRADRGVTLQSERDGRMVGSRQYFHRDPAWGRRIYRFGQQGSATQQVYVTAERVVEGTNYDFFVRLYWTDASRDRVLAMMGFIVNLADVRTRLFPELHRRQLARVLNPAEGSPHLEMEILDEAGRSVFATGESSGSLTPRRTLDMRFYPATSIRTRLVSEVPRRDWILRVGPTVGSTSSALAPIELRGYWLAAVSVLLMLTGLAFAVRGYTHERRLAQSQADFIAHASHQLKTPLTLLNGVCETLLLERARSPERQAQYLDIMRTGTARLTALVERILEFSRVLEGGRRYEMERVEVSSLVREIVDAFRSGFSPEEAQITVETDGSALILLADPVALEQAVLNLLDNAVKYSNRVKKVNVRVFRSAADAIIEVSDHGIGIPERDRERVFEKFYRGAGSSMHGQGFGLGLAIVREIVSAHYGSVDLDSRPSYGSVFRIRLPLAKHARAQAPTEAAALARPRRLVARLRHKWQRRAASGRVKDRERVV